MGEEIASESIPIYTCGKRAFSRQKSHGFGAQGRRSFLHDFAVHKEATCATREVGETGQIFLRCAYRRGKERREEGLRPRRGRKEKRRGKVKRSGGRKEASYWALVCSVDVFFLLGPQNQNKITPDMVQV